MGHGGLNRDWTSTRAVVCGLGVSGFAAAEALVNLGADVLVVDQAEPSGASAERAQSLATAGATLRLGAESEWVNPSGSDLVVTSPGWNPRNLILATAAAEGIPVWGEVELAWRLRGADAASWLCVTGTNGKTTTVQMLDAILRSAGLRSAAVGNVGRPVIDAVLDPNGFDVLAVELSSFQLHWTSSLAAEAAMVLNLAPDHVDWHGSLDAYARDKARIYDRVQWARIFNLDDAASARFVRSTVAGGDARAIYVTRGAPAPGMLGVVNGVLIDRAFGDEGPRSGRVLLPVNDLPDASPHMVSNALAAAALARAHGVPIWAVADGLRGFALGPHRIEAVADVDGVRFVDDSKATNAHAAEASLLGVNSGKVVWVAGGLAKGGVFDDLILRVRDRLRGAVLIGTDGPTIAAALRRHAPDVPLVEVTNPEDGFMDRVVAAARTMAQAGDTVLLAPGCASMDQFRDYADRGDAFADAVRRLSS